MAQPTEFRMIPTAEELAGLDRVLEYRPEVRSPPSRLSGDQVERFDREGFLGPLPILSPDEVQDVRAYFDGLLAEALAAGRDAYSISSAHLSHGRVHDLMTDRRIVDPVADLLGDDVIGWGAHFFCKLPGDARSVAWHQDASYWPLTPSGTLTVWLAIDDSDQENGCVEFIAGSHRFGLIGFRESQADEANVLDQTVEDPARFGTILPTPVPAGSITIHSDLLLHGSAPNHSDRRRCGLTLRYCAAHVRAGLGWNRKGVWVRGGDATGHWANTPRPQQP